MNTKLTVSLVSAFMLTFASSAHSEVSAFSIPDDASAFTEGLPCTHGYEFTVGPIPISVTSLGFYDYQKNGLGYSHKVSIWSGSGVLVGTATVPAGATGTLVGSYRYVSLSPAILLTANTMYVIGSGVSGERVTNNRTVTTAPGVSMGAPRSTQAGGGQTTYPPGDVFGGLILAPNFGFVMADPTLVAGGIHGTVTGGGAYAPNASASLTAIPSPGYIFAGWTGDATGITNPLSVLMDSNKTITATFTPDTADDDGDGLTNYQEIVEYGTNPTKEDTDDDGVKDLVDAFPTDSAETLDTDHDGIGDNGDLDDDGDGLSDVDEMTIHHTNPKRADSDSDGLSDPDEIQVHLTNPNIADSDNDGLTDGQEFLTYHTNPKVGDSDGDGFLDGYEVLTGKSPLDIADHPALVAEARTAIEFTFPAALGKTYRIEDSLDLDTWTIVESWITGNGEVIQRFYSTRGMSKRYFRVEEE